MGSDRRKFIKGLAAGSAGLALGRVVYGLQPSYIFRYENGAAGPSPVFPFFSHASKYNFGEYLPKDQGGKFIQMALLKTEEDSRITELIRSGLIQSVYDDPVKWGKYEKTEIEKSVWLNRFYFLPSFARMYYISGDRSYLDDMMKIIRQWIANNPRLPDSHRTTYNWRDMQVAWRSIHFSWCFYLGENGLTADEKMLITDFLREHADILLTGFGQAALNEFNHQSHGALAMLYLGILFPGLEGAEELRRKGIIILNHHLEKAFYPDGGNVEQMFGYYPFEAHIFRDAYLLCRSNGIEPPLNSVPMLRKMAAYICAVARPDGSMPQVNDSYEMPVQPILDTINEIIEGDTTCRIASAYLPETQVAVLRDKSDGSWYILANPASVIGAHAHAGRLAFELWYSGKLVVTDSGCCNYDDPSLVKWYRTSRAHNTVIIDGLSDAATSTSALWVARRETKNKITKWVTGEDISYLTMVSPVEEAANSSVLWSRTIALVRDRFAVIMDYFEASGDHNYEILFHFPPAAVEVNESRKSLVMNTEHKTEIIPADPSIIESITITEGMVSIAGVSVPAPLGEFKIKRNGPFQSVLAVIPGGAQIMRLKEKKEGRLLTVKGTDGHVIKVLINAGGLRVI